MSFKIIKSTNLGAANYDAATQMLIVQFKNGTQYRYPKVSPELYREFEATFGGENGASAGKFFHANIKHLPCDKIEE